ncbi:hypothetical protein [Maricaulis sp.]|uniref:hypothetical protein n=1 Tax=Maricaulis sp. TaxID=1486257 RepID=UPI0025B96CB1|nr:hypothetical protein [Maricaulis sp.]
MADPAAPRQGPPVDPEHWIDQAVLHIRHGDLRGATVAINRFTDACPDRLHPLERIFANLSRPAQDDAVAPLLRAIETACSDSATFRTFCNRLKAHHRIEVEPDHYTKRIDRRDASVSKLARDWSQATLQVTSQPREERPSVSYAEEVAASLQSALDGDFHSAQTALAELHGRAPQSFTQERIDEALRLLARLQKAPPPDRAILDDRPRDMAVSDRGSGPHTAIIFTGLAERVSGLPISIFDRLLAEAGYRTIFLRDPSRFAFACGIASLGSTAHATIDALRPLAVPEVGGELLVIGTSGGGYASLRYGLELGADRIVVISGGTVCHPDDLAELGDTRVPVVSRRTVARAGPGDFTEPVHAIIGQYRKRPDITLHFAEDMAIDRAHAMLLDGRDGVRLCPCRNTARHNIILTVLDSLTDGALKPV